MMISFYNFVLQLQEAADPPTFEVHKSKRGWTKVLDSYPQAQKHVDHLESLLSKPRSALTDDERLTLRTRFNEHRLDSKGKAGFESRKEQAAASSISSDYDLYRYHLPSSKGLASGRLTLNVAYHSDGSHVKLFNVTEHA